MCKNVYFCHLKCALYTYVFQSIHFSVHFSSIRKQNSCIKKNKHFYEYSIILFSDLQFQRFFFSKIFSRNYDDISVAPVIYNIHLQYHCNCNIMHYWQHFVRFPKFGEYFLDSCSIIILCRRCLKDFNI